VGERGWEILVAAMVQVVTEEAASAGVVTATAGEAMGTGGLAAT